MDGFRWMFNIGLDSKPLLEPWEKFSWTQENQKKLRDETLKLLPTKRSGIKKVKALVLGPQGHGKSSLINSFASVSANERTYVCNAADKESHVTTVFRCFDFPDSFDHCVFCDVTGLSLEKDATAFVKNIEKVIDGHVKQGYTFDPEKKETISENDPYYEKNPSYSDRIHCVIFVFDASKVNDIHKYILENTKSIMEILHLKNIPVMAVLTKADTISSHVAKHIEAIFRCQKVRAAIQDASKQILIPFPKIFPVVNTAEMRSFSWRESIPILIVLRAFLNMAKLHTHNQANN